MKRPKKAEVQYEPVTNYILSVTCPHCRTTLRGIGNSSTLRMNCWQCKNPIDLIQSEKRKERAQHT